MKELKAHFKVTGGMMEYVNLDYLTVNLPKFEGCTGVVHIKKKWSKRSLNQNNLYWMWVEIIGNHFGNPPEEMHTILKGLFAPKKLTKVGDKTYNIPKGTSQMSKGEMVEYMFNVETWANQEGFTLPHPEDMYETH